MGSADQNASSAEEPQFAKLVARCGEVDLLAFMGEYARDFAGTEAKSDWLAEVLRLSALARRDVEELGERAELEERLAVVSQRLFQIEGFRGDAENYDDPRNSLLPEVLKRKRGIPITLSLLFVEIARACGLPCFGAALPGHFMAACPTDDGLRFIDAFHGGERLDAGECEARLREATGLRVKLVGETLGPPPPWVVAARLLRNLKRACAGRDEWAGALAVQRRLVRLLPEELDERRDLGLIELRTGSPQAAVPLLAEYVRRADPAKAAEVEPFLRNARRLTAELN
jgi:regulator of sirC expression with transglutaminase-like and TPR domain